MPLTVESKTVYRFRGENYSSLKSVKRAVESNVGAVIDKIKDNCGNELHPQTKLNILQALIENRHTLCDLLDVTYYDEDGMERDIFDVEGFNYDN